KPLELPLNEVASLTVAPLMMPLVKRALGAWLTTTWLLALPSVWLAPAWKFSEAPAERARLASVRVVEAPLPLTVRMTELPAAAVTAPRVSVELAEALPR